MPEWVYFFSDWTLSELLSSCFEWRQVQKTKDFKFSFMIAWFLLQKLQKRSGLWSRTFWKQGLWRMTYRWKHSINRVFWIYQQDRICPLVYLIIPCVPCAKLNIFCIYALKIWFPEIRNQDTSLSLLAGYFEYLILILSCFLD